VLEVPNRELGATEVGLWHRTLVPADDAGWTQVERGARTQQVVFLVPNEEKEAYVGGEPADDARFVDSIAYGLEHTGGYAPEEARQVVGTMATGYPDLRSYAPGRVPGQRSSARRRCG
jgi:hypothetical protein